MKSYDIKEFAVQVAALRAAQRDYFRTRSPSKLEESKRRERQVDKMLQEILNPQDTLFDT